MNATTTYRNRLPQTERGMFITDGGLETVLVFQENIDLPLFAAFDLLKDAQGIATLERYYLPYIVLAKKNRTGLILDTATWRASAGWGAKLGYSAAEIRRLNLLSVEIVRELRDQHASEHTPMVLNGVIGPQDDGYQPASKMDAAAAQAYHSHQVEAFADSAADMVSAITMTYADEAIGIARAAANAGIPSAISFTVETDGRLPDGMPLQAAIAAVDAATSRSPAYYMINCAHPSHFDDVLDGNESWTDRIRGVRANASCKSHAELDAAEVLDDGDPLEFGKLYTQLRKKLNNLSVVGGCCGTDHRHIGEVCRQLA